MDTSATDESVVTDSLGRRTGPRRQYTLEDKVQIVKETHVKGASVSAVARRHNVNPNQIFPWCQLYRQGLLGPAGSDDGNRMLPVKVGTPTVLPTEHAPRSRRANVDVERATTGREVKLANGHSVVVHGQVDPKVTLLFSTEEGMTSSERDECQQRCGRKS